MHVLEQNFNPLCPKEIHRFNKPLCWKQRNRARKHSSHYVLINSSWAGRDKVESALMRDSLARPRGRLQLSQRRAQEIQLHLRPSDTHASDIPSQHGQHTDCVTWTASLHTFGAVTEKALHLMWEEKLPPSFFLLAGIKKSKCLSDLQFVKLFPGHLLKLHLAGASF